MRKRVPLAVVGVAATIAATFTGLQSLGAAGTTYEFVGWSGGGMVKALNTTVTSALTAASTIEGPKIGASDSNSLAYANISTLATVGAVNTSTASSAVAGGVKLVSHSKTADVNLLNGLIKIKAVDTIASATVANGNITTDTKTNFVGIKIANVTLPLNIPKNFGVTIPGVAQVTLNATFTVKAPDGSAVTTQATGLYLSLLNNHGPHGKGAMLYLNPSYAAIGLQTPTTKTAVHGYAWATKITGNVGTAVNIRTDPTVPISLPGGGTGGITNVNSLASLNLGTAVNLGVVSTTATGINDDTGADARMSVKIAGLNLLNGLIKADVLEGIVNVNKSPAGNFSTSRSFKAVSLYIGGREIPINVAPNTQITLANLGTVTINGQSATPTASMISILTIKLSTAAYGLPAGAVIELGRAAAWITG